MLSATTTPDAPPLASGIQADTFLLHSNPTATKKIFLEFHGAVITNTFWNTTYTNGDPILALPFDLDGNTTNFDGEWDSIQSVWEQVSELFRPFDVDVTTENPTIADPGALFDSGSGDTTWGIRVLIGGSTFDWYYPNGGDPNIIDLGQKNTFHSNNVDVPTFVFADLADGDVRAIALAATNSVGISLGLDTVGQYRYYQDISETPPKSVTVHDIFYGGHGANDDVTSLDPVGNPYYSPTTSWNSIMGIINGGISLTQWSKGEYFNADNDQDQLAQIVSAQNGITYRTDDHANAFGTTTANDALTVTTDTNGPVPQIHLSAGGIIEQNTDQDFFSFTISNLGQVLDLDIDPYDNGANLDILATIYNSAGVAIATSNPLGDIAAGGSTIGDTFGNGDPDSSPGWKIQAQLGLNGNPDVFTDSDGVAVGVVSLNPTAAGASQFVGRLMLEPGTYYVSVQGTGKPITYLDQTDEDWDLLLMDPNLPMSLANLVSSIHPGPILRFGDPIVGLIDVPDPGGGDPIKLDVPDTLPPDNSDYGYSNYGSLGYYHISGTITDSIVGVDFDVATASGGVAPHNWTLFTGSTGNTGLVTGLVSELGKSVPYTLSISTSGASLQTTKSTQSIKPADLPSHPVALNDLKGYLAPDAGATTTFTWSNLEPNTYHTVYVFAHADFAVDNVVTVTGVHSDGSPQTTMFEQQVTARGLEVNKGPEGHEDLRTYAIETLSDSTGQIVISVTNALGAQAAIAGLAISPDRLIGPLLNGTISGEKWNDLNGDKLKDSNEPGLEGWTIYLDQNNNGILDFTTIGATPDQIATATSTSGPLAIPDQNFSGVTSSLNIAAVGTVQDITVSLDITHDWDSDIRVSLISPSGKEVQLFANIGADGDNFHNTVLNDSSVNPIASASAPFTGTFRPQLSMLFDPSAPSGNRLYGEKTEGVWKLKVVDDGRNNIGTLNSWSLTLSVKGNPVQQIITEPVTTTDVDGSYSFTDLAPGKYVVREAFQPSQVTTGWVQTWAPTPVTITSGASLINQDFGNWIAPPQLASIKGQAYYDVNQDGVKGASELPLPGWVVFVDGNNNGVRDIAATATTVNSTDIDKPLLDLTTVRSQLPVSSLGSVVGVSVTLDITHGFMGDLEAYLTSPSGKQVKLFSQVGGPYNDFHNLTLSDAATESIGNIDFNDLPFTGSWKPQESLSLFNGDDAAGTWTLSITDTFTGDEGVLNSWSLSFFTSEQFRFTDSSGNYSLANQTTGTHVVREEQSSSGWTQVPPQTTTIPSATWASSKWTVNVASTSDVVNVDFGNVDNTHGDYTSDAATTANDFVLWRKNPAGYGGALGYQIWRANFGSGTGPGAGTSEVLAAAPGSGVSEAFDAASADALPVGSAAVGSSLDDGPAADLASLSAALPAAKTASVLTVPGRAVQLNNDAIVIDMPAVATPNSDLGLLAWLQSSSTIQQPNVDNSLANDGASGEHSADQADMVDTAFALLEGNALAATTI